MLVLYDIRLVHLAKAQINDTAYSWRNDLVTCLPGQVGTIGENPVFQASGESWEESVRSCQSFQAETLEIHSRGELLELARLLRTHGLSGIVTRAFILPDKITYPSQKPWNWLTPSETQNIIAPLMPETYLGAPINKQVKLIFENTVKRGICCSHWLF